MGERERWPPFSGMIEGMSNGKLVLVRHGQSEWNASNQFTGWYDVALTDKGRAEAVRAGEMMLEAGLERRPPASGFGAPDSRALRWKRNRWAMPMVSRSALPLVSAAIGTQAAMRRRASSASG